VVSGDSFELIEQAVASGGARSALDLLARKFLTEKQYPQLFETRLMQKRLELGLPLIQLGAIEDLPEPERGSYEAGVRAAARETGTLFLAEGDIPHAWPYFRAIGERETVAAAIEEAQPGNQIEALIDIALGERVHPRRGLELVIAQHGICRAITYFEQFPNLEDREACLVLLIRTLHSELIASLNNAIACREGQSPSANSISQLIAGRDWLFGEFDAYVDTSHVINVIRFAVDLEDQDAVRLALELCEYGAHLSAQFKMRGEPPFEDIYRDHAIYLRALLGEDLDAAIAHFKEKIVAQDDPLRSLQSAQVLVGLLLRHQRYREAVEISLEHLSAIPVSAIPANQLACPTLYQLCQLAGDSERLKELARERGDLLSFAAGAIRANGYCTPD
jgi:hypothetical protein